MSDKLKTIPDIIAEKRRIAKSIRDEASNGDYWDKQKANEEAEEYEWDADDIEAAYKREMGNIQKMREALEYVLHFDATDEAAMEDGLTDAERIAEYADHIEECQKKAKAALADIEEHNKDN